MKKSFIFWLKAICILIVYAVFLDLAPAYLAGYFTHDLSYPIVNFYAILLVGLSVVFCTMLIIWEIRKHKGD